MNPYQGLKRLIARARCESAGLTIHLNPYQGLKQNFFRLLQTRDNVILTIHLNPYQGLKLCVGTCNPLDELPPYNSLESLSGIETKVASGVAIAAATLTIHLNPYQGLKREGVLLR